MFKFQARMMLADVLRVLSVALLVCLALAVGAALAIVGVPLALLVVIIVLLGFLIRYVDPR